MMHWKATTIVLAIALATLAGCSQPIYLHDCDEFTRRVGVPPDIACNPNLQNEKASPDVPLPPTIDDPERTPMYVTLHQCIALALENGVTGLQTARNFGLLDDDLVTSQSLGAQFFGDSIRVLALNPAITGTNIEFNMARYDPLFRSVVSASAVDNVAGDSGAFRNGQFANFGVSAEQAFASGGQATIRFGSETNQGITPATNFYSRFAQQNFFTNTLNPQYTPDLSFSFDQPLLYGFGSDINSLLSQHPEVINNVGAQTYNRSVELQQTGIVLARIKFDVDRADFERSVNFMLANVEIAYWNLYGAFVNLFSSEQALRQAHTAWKINKAKYDAGSIAVTQYAQIRGQYEQFRGDRLVALGQVLDAERTLRGLMGLPAADGTRLVPVDTPTVSQFLPDWNEAQRDCLNLRPELVMQRHDLKQKQLELLREKNGLLPDIKLGGKYDIHGAGGRLDGDEIFGGTGLSNNALRVLASDHFNDFYLGVYGAVPLGYRAQNAAVRAAKLRLAQSYLQLRDQEERARRYLVQQYRAVIQDYKVIQARHQQREAFAEQVEARFKEFVAGKTTADFLLQAQRDWANAVSVEYQAIVEYNNALVRFQFAKGTLMQFNGIQVAEGPLPQCVQVRAVENEKQRALAIACREEAYGIHEFASGNPILPQASAAPLPVLIKTTPDLKLEDTSPAPRPLDSLPGQPPISLPSATSIPAIPSGPALPSAPVISTPAPAPSTGTGPVEQVPLVPPSYAAPTMTPTLPAPTPRSLQPNFTPPTMTSPPPPPPPPANGSSPRKAGPPDDGLR
jgi:outer membrane protein TolC